MTARARAPTANESGVADGLKSMRRNSSEANVQAPMLFDSVRAAQTAVATSGTTSGWKAFVRQRKLHDIDPLHRDLDGTPLSDHAWYHFSLDGSRATRLLANRPAGSYLVRVGRNSAVGCWVRNLWFLKNK